MGEATDGPGRAYGAVTLVALVLSVLAFGAHFLPWHAVEVPDWSGAFCFAPDCRMVGEPATTIERCRGFEDAPPGPLTFAALVVLQAVAFARRRRPSPWLGGALAFGATLAGVLSFVMGRLAHLLTSATATGGFGAFGALAGALVVLGFVQFALAWRWRVASRRRPE